MSVKQTLLQQIDNFINELCTIFPKNNDILLFREKYILVKSANSKLVIEYFIQFSHSNSLTRDNMFVVSNDKAEWKQKSTALRGVPQFDGSNVLIFLT